LSAYIPKLFYQRTLCDALALAFQEIQTILRSEHVTSGDSEKINRQLHEIEGVFNFMQQSGLAGLLVAVREAFQKYPNQKNHIPPLPLIDEIFAKLFFFLGDVSDGRKIMAFQLLPIWHQLRPYLSDNSITPASLLSLDLLDVPRAEVIFNVITAKTSEVIASTEDVEQALLDLLRAELQTENLSQAAEIIFNAITEISLRHTQLVQRFYWAVARRFVEVMMRNLAVNLPRSKKILSSVVRVIRQRSEFMWPALPDSLVKEMLYQLAESDVDGDGQTVNTWFQIDAQLSGAAIPWAGLPDARDLTALLNKIDTVIALIPLPNTSQWNIELNEISNLLERIPFVVAVKKQFFESINPWLGKDDLTVIAYLMGLKECVAIALKDRHLQSAAERAITVISEIQLLKSSEAIASQSHHDHLAKIAFYTLQPSSVVAVKTTLLSWLTENELQLDPLLAMRDSQAIAKLIQRALPPVRAALFLLGDTDGVIKVDSLARFGNMQQSHDSEDAVIDISELVEQWVGLCLHIDSKLSSLASVCKIPSYLATVNKLVGSLIPQASNGLAQVDTTLHITSNTVLNTTLKDIFMLEAKDRLSVLRFLVTQFSLSQSELLPAHAAIEAHALAGSSATVGHYAMQQLASALENLIERVIVLAADQQRAYLPELVDTIDALEKQLYVNDSELQADLNSLSNVTLESPLIEVAESIQPVQLEQTAELELLQLPLNHELTQPLQPYELPLQEASSLIDDITQVESSDSEPPPSLSIEERDYPASIDAIDPELHLIFCEEAAELLPQLESLLSQWVSSPGDTSLPAGLLRLMHTLKGSSRMAGELALGEAIHECEHRVTQLSQQRPIDSSAIALLQTEVHQLLIDVGLIKDDTALRVESTSDSASDNDSPFVDRPITKTVVSPTKLRVDLLERASGSVAELLVNAVRSTDDLRQQKQLVVDLADNLARLRTQLRELELQSEASISSQSAPRASGFDPLEFDRYTRLQELTRMTAESMADLTGVQRSLAHQIDASLTMLVAQTRHARSLQSDLYRASTQAFSSIENRFRQLVRQVALEVGRDVRFELDGGQLEIDRIHLESLNGPLSHLVRNAIAHGIEPADERESLGKPRQGLVFIKLSEQGAELRLQVIDDGRGLNFVRIREQAIARGLLSANAEPDTDSLTQLIFESGFSTAEQVTGLAGRGIGMDAVKAAIVAMGGAIKIESQSGLGTSVIMALPKSSSTQKILLVSDAHQKIALPSAMVQQVLSMSSASAHQVISEGFIQWQEKRIALRALSDLIREPAVTHSASDRISFLILHQLDEWIAVKVSEVHGHHEVVVKPPGPQLASVPGLMGAAMLPDGDILLVMNLLQLHAHAVSNPSTRSISATIVPEHVPPLVMVVDDSLTVRRVSQRMLEKQGYGVALARHGAHALELLSQLNPAALLLDIEMPTMDGFELLSRLRSDERFRALPVAMITSRMAERHRQHAMQLGANAYFGKPYREQELLEWLAQCAPLKNLTTSNDRIAQNQALTSAVYDDIRTNAQATQS
jgi:chemotaxis protein histidine kinase CheA/FixJ family two-component response regulator